MQDHTPLDAAIRSGYELATFVRERVPPGPARDVGLARLYETLAVWETGVFAVDHPSGGARRAWRALLIRLLGGRV